MEWVRAVLKRVFCLPPIASVLVAIPSFALVAYVLAADVGGPLAHTAYGLSAYAMVVSITGLGKIARTVHSAVDCHPIVKKVRAHPIGRRYLNDAAFRAEITLYPSLCISLFYAVFKLISGIMYSSVWFITLSVYYILLAVMRFLILTAARRRHSLSIADEYRRYRICGALLAVMALALSGMILFLVRQEGGYSYPGTLIYIMAMYAFYAVITAAVNIVKFRRHGSPTLSAAKVISLTAALVSMLALETAMLSQFGGEDDAMLRPVMLSVSGGVICAFVFVMGIYMIVRGTKQIHIAKGATENGR